jgi:hypothetical protein
MITTEIDLCFPKDLSLYATSMLASLKLNASALFCKIKRCRGYGTQEVKAECADLGINSQGCTLQIHKPGRVRSGRFRASSCNFSYYTVHGLTLPIISLYWSALQLEHGGYYAYSQR